MVIGHLSHIDQYVSIVVQDIYQAKRVHFLILLFNGFTANRGCRRHI